MSGFNVEISQISDETNDAQVNRPKDIKEKEGCRQEKGDISDKFDEQQSKKEGGNYGNDANELHEKLISGHEGIPAFLTENISNQIEEATKLKENSNVAATDELMRDETPEESKHIASNVADESSLENVNALDVAPEEDCNAVETFAIELPDDLDDDEYTLVFADDFEMIDTDTGGEPSTINDQNESDSDVVHGLNSGKDSERDAESSSQQDKGAREKCPVKDDLVKLDIVADRLYMPRKGVTDDHEYSLLARISLEIAKSSSQDELKASQGKASLIKETTLNSTARDSIVAPKLTRAETRALKKLQKIRAIKKSAKDSIGTNKSVLKPPRDRDKSAPDSENMKQLKILTWPNCYFHISTDTKYYTSSNRDGESYEEVTYTLHRDELPKILSEPFKTNSNNFHLFARHKMRIRQLKEKYRAAQSLINKLKEVNKELALVVPDHLCT